MTEQKLCVISSTECEDREGVSAALYLLPDVPVCGHVTDKLCAVGEGIATEGAAVVVLALFMA